MRSLPISAYCNNCATDDDRLLLRALASVNFCEQKIFVSDHSKESSKELAKRMGWEIFEWTGPNSMAERRNFSIAWEGNETVKPFWTTDYYLARNHPVIRNDYILQLDSDEVYGWDTYLLLKSMFSQEEYKGFTVFAFYLKSVKPDAQEMSLLPLDRMWKKGHIYWEKDIQNNSKVEDRVFIIPEKIYHYGYGENKDNQFKQWKRLTANENEARKTPEDMQALMYLLNCLVISASGQPLAIDRIMGTFALCEDAYSKGPKSLLEKHSLEKCLRFLWCACIEKVQKLYYIEKQMLYYQETKEHPDTNWRLYDSYLHIGDYANAIRYGEKFVVQLKKFNFHEKETVMEITNGKDMKDVIRTIVDLSTQISKLETDTKLKKMYERKAKYWSKQ